MSEIYSYLLTCYILLIDQISLSGCLYFVTYLAVNHVVTIVCKPRCYVMTFEVKLIFLIKPFFLYDSKVVTKT